MNLQKLAEELDDLRSKTQLELERLRVQERQVHEIEANTLRDQREQAVIERDRARNAERDALDKFDELNQRYTRTSVLCALFIGIRIRLCICILL